MDDFDENLDWALETTKKVTTVYDQLKWMWEPRETIVETPRVGLAEGVDVQNTNIEVNRGADVIEWGKDFYAQVKGLFGLGYPSTEKQPVSIVEPGTVIQQTGVDNKYLFIALAIGALWLLQPHKVSWR